jgi:hypothetical protein
MMSAPIQTPVYHPDTGLNRSPYTTLITAVVISGHSSDWCSNSTTSNILHCAKDFLFLFGVKEYSNKFLDKLTAFLYYTLSIYTVCMHLISGTAALLVHTAVTHSTVTVLSPVILHIN